jgi:hypothetical protein
MTDASGAAIASFTVAAVATGFQPAQRSLALVQDRVLTNVDLQLQPGTVNAFFTEGFEAPTSWIATGLWNRSALSGIVNRAHPQFVTLAPNDQSQGALPRPAGGSWAFWYGTPATGNFIGTQSSSDAPLSGGTSTTANAGTLISPPIALPTSSTLSLRFDTWFEIESVNPNSSGFDIMEVAVVDGTTTRVLGRLNPFVDPTLPNRRPIPFTSGGFNLAPVWRTVSFDLSAFSGRTVQLRFGFRTVDSRYNGFRGWIVDNVSVSNMPAMQESVGVITTAPLDEGRPCRSDPCAIPR